MSDSRPDAEIQFVVIGRGFFFVDTQMRENAHVFAQNVELCTVESRVHLDVRADCDCWELTFNELGLLPTDKDDVV